MQISCLEDYQNLVDWYYESEYTESTLYEDLYPLKLMATCHVEECIKKSYKLNLSIGDVEKEVKDIIDHYRGAQ